MENAQFEYVCQAHPVTWFQPIFCMIGEKKLNCILTCQKLKMEGQIMLNIHTILYCMNSLSYNFVLSSDLTLFFQHKYTNYSS